MEIEIIKIASQEDPLDATRHFGLLLKKIQGHVHMLHWYANDYQIHLILGELYESIDELFDKLQEEIIGTSKIQKALFPTFSNIMNMDEISKFKGKPQDIVNGYNQVASLVKEVLTSLEFNSYITSVKSGLTNTKEDIITAFNKADYLLSLINIIE
jgi:DNA-binding ferritin-like protein